MRFIFENKHRVLCLLMLYKTSDIEVQDINKCVTIDWKVDIPEIIPTSSTYYMTFLHYR